MKNAGPFEMPNKALAPLEARGDFALDSGGRAHLL